MPALTDHTLMKRAMQLARRGQGYVEPNPMVGCVLVKGGRIVGEGWHKRFGGPHAEVEALSDAGHQARGATAYVTLEPCNFHGKTPACTHALRSAGIRRVVAATRDPNPPVNGRGIRALRRWGIEVTLGLLEDEALRLIAPFTRTVRSGRPFLIAKWAQSLDGCSATHSGDSQWISSAEARRLVHRLRGRVDGIIVGSGTVLQDDPQLTCRDMRPRRVAARIVLDTRLRTPARAQLVTSANTVPTHVFTSHASTRRPKARALTRAGVEIHGVRLHSGHVDLLAVLEQLSSRMGMSNILLEGGSAVLGSAFDRNLIDEAYTFISPRVIGGHGATPAIGGRGHRTVALSPIHPHTVRRIGADVLIHVDLSTVASPGNIS